MAFIPVPNVAKVTLQWLWAGQIVDLTLSVQKASPLTTSDLDTLNTTAVDWWDDGLKIWSTQALSLVNVNSTDQSSDSAPSIDYPVTPAIPGENTSGSVPNNVALVTSWLTDLRGRSFRGRAYTPGIPVNMVSTSTTANPSLVGAHNTIYSDWISRVLALSFDPVVVSRYTGGAPRLVGIATPITGVRTEQYFDSQRRRLAGRGI